jgi:hypothetical protein
MRYIQEQKRGNPNKPYIYTTQIIRAAVFLNSVSGELRPIILYDRSQENWVIKDLAFILARERVTQGIASEPEGTQTPGN